MCINAAAIAVRKPRSDHMYEAGSGLIASCGQNYINLVKQ